MSLFSENLYSIVRNQKMTITSLANAVNVDRTVLQKILKGTRKPADIQFVDNICSALMLSPDTKSILVQQYKMVEMGEEVYYSRKNVAKVINRLSHKQFEFNTVFDFKTDLDIAEISEITFYYDHDALVKNIQALVSYEFQHGSDINISAQPSENLNNILKYCIDENSDNKINHVFCLDNNRIGQNSLVHNLDIFSFVSEFALKHGRYNPFYYYGDIESCLNFSGIMPYIIITENFVICTNNDFSNGVIYKSKEQVDFYLKQFKYALERTKPFVKSASDVESLCVMFSDVKIINYTYNYQSELSLYIDRAMFDKYNLLNDIESEAMDLLFKLIVIRNNCNGKNVFSENGLKEFMNTGRFSEFPECFYKPLSENDRKTILKRMIKAIEKGRINCRIAKNDYEIFKNKLCIGIINDNCISMQLAESFRYIVLEEISIVSAFKDYIESLFESDLVYSKEETIEIIKKYL